jgi:hypothetical protein
MRNLSIDGLGRLHRLVFSGLLVVAVAACGGGSSAATSSPSSPASTSAGTGSTAEATPAASNGPVVTTVEVGQEAWFAGFHVIFGTATSEITPDRGGTVEIEAKFENTGDESARLDATLTLVSGDETATEGFGMDIPSVPGGQTGKGTLAFDVEDTFTFDDAVLTLGQPTNQQAVVPLSVSAGKAVSRKPVAVTISGSGQAGDLKLDVTGGELRADTPWKHGQQEQGTLVLSVDYSATFDSGFAGGFAFTAENVALRLPDGTTVGVIQDGESQSTELIGPNATMKHLFSRFEIEDPAAGPYALLVRSFDGAEDEIPFSLD